jgi:anti-sigma-K factor RskA
VTEYSRQVAELSTKLKDEGDIAHLKISTLASMLGNTPAALAVAVWDPTREQGVLEVSKLPALATEKDYQLWVIDAKYPSPVSAGVFVVDPVSGEAHIVFKTDKPVRSIAKFAVSLERKGGVPKPEGPIVLLSQ